MALNQEHQQSLYLCKRSPAPKCRLCQTQKRARRLSYKQIKNMSTTFCYAWNPREAGPREAGPRDKGAGLILA